MLKDPESVRIRNSVGFIDSENPFHVVGRNALIVEQFDYISVSYPTDTTEVYTYKSGGSSGTIVATVTVVYQTSTKENLSSVTKV